MNVVFSKMHVKEPNGYSPRIAMNAIGLKPW